MKIPDNQGRSPRMIPNHSVKVPDDVGKDPKSPDDQWSSMVGNCQKNIPNEIRGDLLPSLIVQEIVEIIF